MKRILFIVMAAFMSLCYGDAFAKDMINGAGATFPYPLYSAWAFQYQRKTGIRLNYQSIGSGGGVRQIVNRTVDFGASDDGLAPEKVEKDGLLQWPQVIGGEVLVVNIPGVKTEEMLLDAKTVCRIFLGEITKWSDPGIAALNRDLRLPDKKIIVVHRSDGSGTTAVFTHYLDGACSMWRKKVGYGKSVKWPVGIGGKGNEGVANYVKRVKYSIGYVEFAYAKQNKLTYTLLKNAAGNVVKPTLETFSEAAKAGDYDPGKHFYTWVTNTKGRNAWPIVAATNILVARDNGAVNKKVVRFFEWAFSKEADEMARRLVYAPLPDYLKDRVREYWKANGIFGE